MELATLHSSVGYGTKNASIVVGISEMAISRTVEDTLVTYSLGSCLGIAIYDPAIPLGGMIHCMLPFSKADPEKARQNPCMFVDTGMPLLLTELFKRGMKKHRAVVKAAGAAKVLDINDMFRIGERNHMVFRKVLWKNEMLITAEDVGGSDSRTIRLEISTGRFTIRSVGVEREL